MTRTRRTTEPCGRVPVHRDPCPAHSGAHSPRDNNRQSPPSEHTIDEQPNLATAPLRVFQNINLILREVTRGNGGRPVRDGRSILEKLAKRQKKSFLGPVGIARRLLKSDLLTPSGHLKKLSVLPRIG